MLIGHFPGKGQRRRRVTTIGVDPNTTKTLLFIEGIAGYSEFQRGTQHSSYIRKGYVYTNVGRVALIF